ncbi:unnamed protein product [Coccothraustes coccothraustes]
MAAGADGSRGGTVRAGAGRGVGGPQHIRLLQKPVRRENSAWRAPEKAVARMAVRRRNASPRHCDGSEALSIGTISRQSNASCFSKELNTNIECDTENSKD